MLWVDAYIVATDTGASPLGANLHFLSSDLGVPAAEIEELAAWNQRRNPRVTLVAVRTRREGSLLRGEILAPSGSCECYRPYAARDPERPWRDFHYNVSYVAIAHACTRWGAVRLAVSDLSGAGRFNQQIVTCNAEALAHFCDEDAHRIPWLTFLGSGVCRADMAEIASLNREGATGRHRPIGTQIETHEGYELIHLDWEAGA